MTKKITEKKAGITQCIYISKNDIDVFNRILKSADNEKRGIGFLICRAWEKYEEAKND